MAKAKKRVQRFASKRSVRGRKAASNGEGWFDALLNSQTGRTIAAEVLIAAAGAAAAVLLSGKADAVVEAGQTAVDQAKKTSKKTLDAANKAMSTAKKHASNIVEATGRASGLKQEPTQHDLAEKALEMKKRVADQSETYRQFDQRSVPEDTTH